ncbi:hypothetical protein [Mesorhizobium mediterraneum]|uniref:hypothetical protein n=1 Tax=Mesorhizobium mediterraneum TaxID=43617 RepID=UPI0017834B33|nr:hypothetical protein [Mesorhizobium mediterraneum]
MAEAWIIRNIGKNGLFTYSINPYTGEKSKKNNELRQLMSSRTIAEMSARNLPLRPVHRRNLSFIMTSWYREEGGIGYIEYDGKSKLGANAMLLRTFAASPHFEQYRLKAGAAADGILALQNADGSFRPWLKEPNYPFDAKYLLTFYSGEALVALLEYYFRTGLTCYFDEAARSAEFYLEEYVRNIADNFYPAYVPWHTIAYRHLYELTKAGKFAEAVFTLNDKLLELQDRSYRIGRFFNPATPQYGQPHASSDGVYTEGLAYAFEMALRTGDPVRARRYLDAITISLKNIASLQYREKLDESSLPFYVYRGAIRTNAGKNSWARIDNAQHTIDAIRALGNFLGSKQASTFDTGL